MRRLKLLEDENAKLRKLVADLSLAREMLQDVNRQKTVGPARKRKLLDGMRGVVGFVDPACVPGSRGRHIHLSLQIPPPRSGRAGS